MAKNTNLSFTVTIGNISHTFTYFSKRNVFRVSSHHKTLIETKYKEFSDNSFFDKNDDSRSPYLKAHLFFLDVIHEHLNHCFKSIDNKYFSLPF